MANQMSEATARIAIETLLRLVGEQNGVTVTLTSFKRKEEVNGHDLSK